MTWSVRIQPAAMYVRRLPGGVGLLAGPFTRSFLLIYTIHLGFLVKNLVINHHKREREPRTVGFFRATKDPAFFDQRKSFRTSIPALQSKTTYTV